ncbi:MAG: hypothetical protein PVF12_07470, partial [Thiohalocapsa sp.]
MATRKTTRSLIGFPLVGLLLRLTGLLLLVLVLLLGFVLGTQTGLRMAVALAEELAPDRVAVGRVDGRVLGELTLADVVLDLPSLSLDLGRLHLDWQPARLLSGELRVADLSVADLDIITAPPPADKPPAEPLTLPEIRLPIAVDIDRVLVERLSLRQQDAPPASAIRVNRAELSAAADGDRVDLRRLSAELAQPEASAQAQGSVRLTGDYPLDLTLDWRFRQAPALELTGDGSVGGDLATLRITHSVAGAVAATLSATVRDVLSEPAWQGELQLDRVDLPAVVPDAPEVNLQASLKTEGDLERATVTGTLDADAPALADFGKLSADLDLTWAEQRLTLNRVQLDETASGAVLELNGHADLAGAVPAFVLQGTWERLRWPLTGEVLVAAPQGKVTLDGDLDAFDYRLDGDVLGAEIPEARLSLTGAGSARDTRIESLLVETLGGRIEAKGSARWEPAVTWDLAVTAADIDPGQQLPGLGGQIALKAASQGGLDTGYSFGAKLTAALTEYPDAVVNVAGSGDLERVQLATFSVETLGGLIAGEGDLAWVPALAWKLALRADDLDPGLYDPALAGRVGFELSSAGGLEEGYDYNLKGSAALAAYPPATLDLGGTGTAEAMDVSTLDIQVLDGSITGSARVAWVPAVQWDAALALSGLDPGSLAADWPGRLGGTIESSGQLTEQGPDLTVRISEISGELRGYPVRLAAELGMAGEVVELRNLTAGSGSARLSAAGGLTGEQLDLRFDLASPDLAALLPGASGSLDLAGEVTGTAAAPRVRLNLQGRDAELNGQGIGEVTASADVGLGPGDDFDIDLSGNNLVAGGQRFETLSVQGSGRMDRHQLRAAASGDLLSLELAASGGLGAEGAYAGRLDSLRLVSGDFGAWRLQRPAGLAFGDGAASAGPLCLGNGEGSGGCVGFEQPQPGRFEVSLDVDHIDFDILNPLLPELLVMEGGVRAQGRFRVEGNVLSGSARMEVPTGKINMALGEDQGRDVLVFSGTGLDVEAGRGGLDARLNLSVTDLGGVRAAVSLPGFRLDSGAGQALRGDVSVSLDGLSRISNLLPDVTDITGNIDGDLQLAGTLGGPDLRGELRARGLGLQVPLYGFAMSSADVTLTSRSADTIALTGGADIGAGRIALDGNIGLGGSAPAGEIRIQGDNLKILDSSEYFALLSMDMTVGVGVAG